MRVKIVKSFDKKKIERELDFNSKFVIRCVNYCQRSRITVSYGIKVNDFRLTNKLT